MHDPDDAETTDEAPPIAAGRREVLRTLSVPPIAATLSGCQSIGGGADAPDGRAVDDLEPGETTDYGTAVRFGEVYGMAVTRATDGTTVLTGRFHGDDRYLRFDGDEGRGVTESYLVDGDGYVVADGQCSRYPDLTAGLESVEGVPDDVAADAGSAPALTVTGSTTIDGRKAVILELPAGELDEYGEELTTYVDAETGYVRRIETGSTVVDYHSWGDVDPVDAPDCPSSR